MKGQFNKGKYFRYSGKNIEGEIITNKIIAQDRHDAIKRLTQEKIQILNITPLTYTGFTLSKNPISNKEIDLFTRQLATTLGAGLALSESIWLISQHYPNKKWQYILTTIKSAIEEGDPLSEALKRTSLFNATYITLVYCAETSGKLSQTFDLIANYREKSTQQKAKFIKAMLYPIFVIVIALAITYLMLTGVLPEFEKIFLSFNAPLPSFTQQIMQLSRWLNDTLFIQTISFLFVSLLFRISFTKFNGFRLFIDKRLTYIPIVGRIISLTNYALYSRTLAMLAQSGIPIVRALQDCIYITRNRHYQAVFKSVFDETTSGTPIYIAMKKTKFFPNLMVQLIMVGEQSGTLESMLYKSADIFEKELDDTIDRMNILIEPILILFLGLVIGAIIIAIYLPIFNMMTVLG